MSANTKDNFRNLPEGNDSNYVNSNCSVSKRNMKFFDFFVFALTLLLTLVTITLSLYILIVKYIFN